MKKTVIRRIIAACMFTATGTAYGQNTFPATGNVGIGTSSPSFNLDVPGLAAFSGSGANLDPKRTNNVVPLQNSGKLLIGWNRIAGNGETDLIANMGPGNVGGFSFYDYSNTGVWTNLMRILGNGNVGIGTTAPTQKLSVDGNINAKEVIVTASGWPDYVFKKDYRLPSLIALSEQIKTDGHLPDMPSAEEVAANGQSLGEMNKKLLQKVEELTLYIIRQDKALSEQRQRNDTAEEKLNNQQAEIEALKAQNRQILSIIQKNR